MNLVIIAALVVLAFIFLRAKHMKHKIYLILVIALILFIYITATRVLSGQEFDWKSTSDLGKAAKMYFSWLGSVSNNFKDLSGRAVDLDWKLNSTRTKEK
tara:strand:- start:140 stop:439 length:300 start_codon:yes stop_codon:yes gene_type:complete